MKKIEKLIYIVTFLIFCLFPFAGMFVNPTNETTENRRLAEFPSWTKNGTLNSNFMQELGTYFEDHFAFRPYLVSFDAEIQSKLFQVSNVDTVTVGKDGWLYYSSSLDDYMGRNRLSNRGIFDASNNLRILQQYVEQNHASFFFTVPPNKNSLYGEHMPYYYKRCVDQHTNLNELESMMKQSGVHYVDLYSVFSKQKETLYLKRDSHWNEKGALIAYNSILEEAQVEHNNYDVVPAVRVKNEYGDLNKMLYPVTAEPEWNYAYQKKRQFTYCTDTKSVEDPWIETVCTKGKKNCLMFRDSFGNALLPFFADTFKNAYFSKEMPCKIEEYMNRYDPDVVVLEKVERNIKDIASTPPLMEALEITSDSQCKKALEDKESQMEIAECENDAAYWSITGQLSDRCKDTARIYVSVFDGTVTKIYEAFTVMTANSDYGFTLYLKKENYPELSNAKITVFVQ